MSLYPGDDTNFPESITEIDDSDSPNAANFNQSPEGLADRTAWLRAHANVRAVANWNTPLDTTTFGASGTSVTASCWDPFEQQWIASGVETDGGFLTTISSADGGKSWTAINPPATPGGGSAGKFGIAMAVDPLTGVLCTLTTDLSPTAAYVARRDQVAGSVVSTAQPFLDGVGRGVMFNLLGGGFLFVGSTGLALTTFVGAFAASVDGSGLWTNRAADLPASWASGTNSILQYLVARDATPTAIVVAMCGLTPGSSDRSRLMSLSPSGGSGVDITPSFLASGALQLRGWAYDAAHGVWGALTLDASNVAKLWTSPDLTTWTDAHTFTNSIVGSLAILNGVWAVLLYDRNTDRGYNRIVYSGAVHKGGSIPWSAADYVDLESLSSLSFPALQLLSSGAHLLRAANGLGSFSKTLAVSHTTGVLPGSPAF